MVTNWKRKMKNKSVVNTNQIKFIKGDKIISLTEPKYDGKFEGYTKSKLFVRIRLKNGEIKRKMCKNVRKE